MGSYGLPDWAEVEVGDGWPLLLAGNGASLAVSAQFAYASLLDAATLGSDDRALFDSAGTANFEELLRALDFATLVAGQLGWDSGAVAHRRDVIRQALVDAVHAHHVPWVDVDAGDRLTAIKEALASHSAVFTTSYDLLFYWAINYGGATGFVDYFWQDGHRFDASDTNLWGDATAVHWLHGGLQLYRDGPDGTAKRTNTGAALLAQFADGGLLPLYVAEGTALQKRRAIRRSDYLTFCLDSFETDGRDLVVFGQALGNSDRHLVDAIRGHPDRRVAYAVYPADQLQVERVEAETAEVLGRGDIIFFDSGTHPLGAATLAV